MRKDEQAEYFDLDLDFDPMEAWLVLFEHEHLYLGTIFSLSTTAPQLRDIPASVMEIPLL